MTRGFETLIDLNAALEDCQSCPRLVAWRTRVGLEKRAAFRDQSYWARPVPGFGDADARILILGLAPGAHGSNRTGRMFTGDASGDFLFPALFRTGIASKSEAVSRDDGLVLTGAYITAAARCAPPQNRPSPEELRACETWLEREVAFLREIRVVLALGQIAHDTWLEMAGLQKSKHAFGHGLERAMPDGKILLDSYHVSRQNTQTGRLTPEMFDAVLLRAKVLAKA